MPRAAEVSGRRILSRLFGLAAAGAMTYAIFLFVVSRAGEIQAILEEPNPELTHLVPERDYVVNICVYNRTVRRVRIVGMGIS